MSELVEFIRGCLDADEQTARAATKGEWQPETARNGFPAMVVSDDGLVVCDTYDKPHLSDARLIARHDPARVLAEVNAKRAILDLHQPRYAVLYRESDRLLAAALDSPTVPTVAHSGPIWPTPQSEATLLALAQPFAGEPGWRDEWGTQ